MGITTRNAPPGPEARPTPLRGIAPLKLALSVLAILLVSSVLAQSGGSYTVSRWAAAGGGAMFSTGAGYTAGITVAQPGAGKVAGGSYTIYGGFWQPVGSVPPRPIHLPMIVSALPTPTPTPTSPCPEIEPNNIPSAASLLSPASTPCVGSFENGPDSGQATGDDYYRITLSTQSTIGIGLTALPSGANYDLVLYNAALTQLGLSNQPGSADESIIYPNATPGNYYIRIYMRTRSPNANTYLLRVTLN